MHTAKKPKVEGAESDHPAENSSDDDDDDDLFISVWDGKSTKKTSSNETNKPKSKPLPSTASGSGKSKQNITTGHDRNGLVTTSNNPSRSRVSPRKLQNQNSRTCKKILNSTTNGNGQASTGLNPVVRNESIHSRNSSCSSTNDLNKSPSSELGSSVLQNQDSSNNNNVDSSTNNEDHNSTSGVDSEMHVERIDSKNDPHSSPCDWDKPSCSGINSIGCDVVDLSLETDLCFLKNMFPSVDEDVLKSYLEIYQDMEECVRVVSNLLYGGVDIVDDIYINEDLKPTASETPRDTKQTLNNCSDTINTHEHKSPISNHSNLPIKKESVNDSPGEKRLKDHYGKSKKTDLKSERKLDNHNSMENKVPLSSNSREVNTGSSRSLHTMRTPPSSSKKKPKPSSKETSLNDVLTTNGERESKSQTLDTKVCPTDSKFHTSNSLPSTNIVQVGIDIRFGKNKVHPSMKRCLDKSLASRDIAQPYRGNRDTKASQKSSGDVKDTLDCSSDPSPSKRVCKGNSTITTSTHNSSSTSAFVDARSGDLRGSPLTSRDSSANTVAQSPSKRGQGQSSSQNSSSTITFTDARSSDSRGSLLTSRDSSANTVAQSTSKRGQGQSSTSRNPSEDSNTNFTPAENITSSQPSTISGTDFSSFINSVSKRMLESQGSLVSNQNAEMPSKKGKDPSKKGKVSPDNNSRTYDFTISSSSRNPSEDSNTNFTPAENLTRSQPSAISGTDFRSFINSVSKRMLESQGSLVSNQNAEMPSNKGKCPKLPTSSPSTYSFDANEGIHIDWGNVVRSMNDNQSSSATNTQPQIATPNKTITDQSTGIHQGKTANNGQTMFTTVVKQESQNQSTSPTNGTPNRLATAYLNPEQMVLVVRKDKSDSNECLGLPSESQNLPHSSQQEELSVEEEAARQEMLDLQRDTEMLTKVCPESDPNYIFSRLEELKDKPNRVAIVNKELIENASITGDVENVIQKQKKVVWSWEDKKMRRIPFSRAESNIIESKYTKHNGNLVEVKFSSVTLVLWFNFNSMTVQETLKNKIRHVYRTESMEEIVPGKDDKRQETGLSLPPLSNPETWHGHGSSTSNTTTAMTRDLFEVLPGTSEFAHVDVLLKKSLPQAIIKKIKRVKNDWLERKYGIQRALLREKNGPGVINEMELFHGTRQTPPSVVWDSEEGFDMRYSADGMWGRGCYFAVNAAYSHHQFTHQYIHKRKRYYQIFLAHVLTGESINTDPDRSIRKPPLNVATGRHYDSITGITQGHRIYVLYKNEASFPAYLITYTM